MKKLWTTIIIVSLLTLASCHSNSVKEEKIESEQKPQVQAVEISLENSIIPMYLSKRVSEPRVTPITHVMIHFSSNVIEKPEDPFQIKDTYNVFKEYGVSPHYVIDRSGQIHRLVPEDRVAYHAGKGKVENYPKYENNLNAYSIGIELLGIGTKEEMLPIITEEHYDRIDPKHIGFTEKQYESLNLLLMDISTRYDTVNLSREHIIGHNEYAPERKTDPGVLFDWDKLENSWND